MVLPQVGFGKAAGLSFKSPHVTIGPIGFVGNGHNVPMVQYVVLFRSMYGLGHGLAHIRNLWTRILTRVLFWSM